jgi:hypothetical protein|tara:strand:+ start:563 stop:1723 length:1161 start_codon:yes stop_codon:yes gene_type:complete
MAKKKEVTEEVAKVDLSNKVEATDNVTKVNLDKPIENETKDEIKEDNPDNEGVVGVDENADATEKQEEVQPEVEAQETPVLEEVTEEDVKEQAEELTEQVEEAIAEAKETGRAIPENVQKLMDFMEDTGGTLEDYVTLNQDFSSYDDITLLREFYKKTKSHLTPDEVDFLIDDNFSFDEEVDEEREIKKKKIALKEQVANAKSHLDGQKSKYYEEIKAGSKLTKDQQKAVDFFNRYNKESKETDAVVEKQTNTFKMKTNNVFSKDFKGFDYNVGDKKYRFNVKDSNKVKESQSDINNFVKKFLNENNEMSDAKGYHKSLFTANNPDAIAKHFYEQGKADALKTSVAKAKNVDMNPRQQHGTVDMGGMKVKVLGESSNDFKFKIKNK